MRTGVKGRLVVEELEGISQAEMCLGLEGVADCHGERLMLCDDGHQL